MTLRIEGATLHLGRLRKDGRRNVERVRLADWRKLLPLARKAKIAARMDGDRLTVALRDDVQLKLAFMSESA